MPHFSVIIPLYNKAPYVRKTVESVLCQTFTDWELIIIDNGSTDGSNEVVAEFTDSRIQIVQLAENVGVSNARNKGVELSTAPYITFLDADDWWEPTFLEEMAWLIERYPNVGIYGTGYYIVKNGKKRVAPIGVEEGFSEGEINYCTVYAQTLCMPLTSISVCMPREVFEEAGGFPAGIKLGEDFLLWVKVALKHKVVLLNKPLSNYNQDVDSAFRGTHNKRYNPDTFMTFHFDRFAKEETKSHDLKVLLDRLRVYTLMNFRKDNLFPNKVQQEISKVDFKNVDSIYRFYYKAPYWVVKPYLESIRLLSAIKHKIKR